MSTEINSVATNIQSAMMLQGVSRNMQMNTPNERQSLKGVSKNMPFNYESSKHAQQDYKSEVYYNYNRKGERVMIQQIGNKVDIKIV